MNNEFDYKKYLLLIAKRKGLFAFVALLIMTVSVIISYLLPKKFEANSTVFIEKSVISDLVKGIAVTPSIEDKIKVLKYAISSRTLLVKVIDELDLNVKKAGDAQLEEMIKKLQKNTDIKIKDKEGLFIISFQDENPRVARDYVNTLVRRYIEENVSSKREESYGATKFLSEQIGSFKEKMDKADEQLNSYRQGKSTLLAADEARLLQENAAAQQKIDELRIRRNQLEAQRNLMVKGDPAQAKLRALKKRLEELQVEYTDNYPEVIRVKTEIDSLREQTARPAKAGVSHADPQELERIDVELQSLRSSEESQRRIIAANQGVLRGIPEAKSTLEELKRDRDQQKALYEQLVTRHGQSEVSKQVEVQDKSTTFRIVDPAVTPIKPVSPNRVRIILMGIAAGLGAGLGLLLLLDILDGTVKNVATLKEMGLPVIAMIPRIRTPEDQLRQGKRDIRIYRLAGAYFLLILVVLGRELYRQFL